MQSASSRIWARVAVSISYDDNNYTRGTSIEFFLDWTPVSRIIGEHFTHEVKFIYIYVNK